MYDVTGVGGQNTSFSVLPSSRTHTRRSYSFDFMINVEAIIFISIVIIIRTKLNAIRLSIFIQINTAI